MSDHDEHDFIGSTPWERQIESLRRRCESLQSKLEIAKKALDLIMDEDKEMPNYTSSEPYFYGRCGSIARQALKEIGE